MSTQQIVLIHVNTINNVGCSHANGHRYCNKNIRKLHEILVMRTPACQNPSQSVSRGLWSSSASDCGRDVHCWRAKQEGDPNEVRTVRSKTGDRGGNPWGKASSSAVEKFPHSRQVECPCWYIAMHYDDLWWSMMHFRSLWTNKQQTTIYVFVFRFHFPYHHQLTQLTSSKYQAATTTMKVMWQQCAGIWDLGNELKFNVIMCTYKENASTQSLLLK